MTADLCQRVRDMPTTAEPWPYATCDNFLPEDVFADFVKVLPGLAWKGTGSSRKADNLPKPVTDLLLAPPLLDAFAERFDFAGKLKRVQLEAAWFGERGLHPHVDRSDKLLSAQVYLAGEPKGTELYDATGKLASVIEWAPNRLAAWTRPPQQQKHAAPKSSGRYVLLYWFLG